VCFRLFCIFSQMAIAATPTGLIRGGREERGRKSLGGTARAGTTFPPGGRLNLACTPAPTSLQRFKRRAPPLSAPPLGGLSSASILLRDPRWIVIGGLDGPARCPTSPSARPRMRTGDGRSIPTFAASNGRPTPHPTALTHRVFACPDRAPVVFAGPPSSNATGPGGRS